MLPARGRQRSMNRKDQWESAKLQKIALSKVGLAVTQGNKKALSLQQAELTMHPVVYEVVQ